MPKMKKIYKYEIESPEFFLPKSAEVVKAGTQKGGGQFVWAMVDPEDTELAQKYVVRGTGHDIQHNLKFQTTWFTDEFVWHLFKVESLVTEHA